MGKRQGRHCRSMFSYAASREGRRKLLHIRAYRRPRKTNRFRQPSCPRGERDEGKLVSTAAVVSSWCICSISTSGGGKGGQRRPPLGCLPLDERLCLCHPDDPHCAIRVREIREVLCLMVTQERTDQARRATRLRYAQNCGGKLQGVWQLNGNDRPMRQGSAGQYLRDISRKLAQLLVGHGHSSRQVSERGGIRATVA